MSTLKRSFIVDISTATPRHWTPYRGLTSDGRKGLIVDAIYYRCLNVRIPEIQGSVAAAPPKITLVFGNADNIATDLCFDASNIRADVVITRLNFADTPWQRELAPVIASRETWFTGFLGTPSFDDEKETITVVCHANVGRRGKSPSTKSRSLMLHHSNPPANAHITVSQVVNSG